MYLIMYERHVLKCTVVPRPHDERSQNHVPCFWERRNAPECNVAKSGFFSEHERFNGSASKEGARYSKQTEWIEDCIAKDIGQLQRKSE